MGPKGQVVIPKAARERLGVERGDDVVFHDVEGGVIVRRAMPLVEMRGICRGGPGLIGEWEAFKAGERELEQAREARLGAGVPADGP